MSEDEEYDENDEEWAPSDEEYDYFEADDDTGDIGRDSWSEEELEDSYDVTDLEDFG